MLIVDAQVHIWANRKPTNANHRQVESFSAGDCWPRWTRRVSTPR